MYGLINRLRQKYCISDNENRLPSRILINAY